MSMDQVKMLSFLMISMWFMLEAAALFLSSTEEIVLSGKSNFISMIVLISMVAVSLLVSEDQNIMYVKNHILKYT